MADPKTPSLMVTGAGGHLGRRVVELLLASNAGRVVAGSRHPDRLDALAAKGVETRRVDFDDPESLTAAFKGVDRLLIISTDALGPPGRRLRQHKAAVGAAAEAGVKHVVYTSMPRPEPGSPIPFAPDHDETEQALAAGPFGRTVLRNAWYTDGLLGALPPRLASGRWFTSAGDGRIAYVTREDCAQVAAKVLASESSANALYDITGPQALTTGEVAEIAGEVLGKPITVVPVSDEQLAQGLAGAGLPPFVVELLVAGDANTRAGRAGTVSDDVKTILGREPQSLREFLTANRSAFQPTP